MATPDLNPGRRAAPAGWQPTHRHNKRGTTYRLLTRGLREHDLTPVAIYEDAHGITWSRPLADFEDPGRFTPVTPETPAAIAPARDQAPPATHTGEGDPLEPADNIPELVDLLNHEIVVPQAMVHLDPDSGSAPVTGLAVPCFGRFDGGAQAVELPVHEITNLHAAWRAHGDAGVVRWCALARGQRPNARTCAWLAATGLLDSAVTDLSA